MKDHNQYDMRINPVYQIDCSAVGSGKRVAATKRRVRWRFGFSNAEAISNGMTGINCRGSEHEVSLVWSLTSGKRQVFCDNAQVHFSKGKVTETKFECTWTMPGDHIVKIIAHATPPLVAKPGFRQFDLILDGFSFFDFPCIYELGVIDAVRKTGNHATSPRSVYHQGAVVPFYGNVDTTRDRSYNSVQALPEEHHAPSPPPRSNSMPEDILSNLLEAGSVDQLDSPLTMDHSPSMSPTVYSDEFAPQAALTYPEPPSFQAVTNQIMSAYPTPPPAPVYPALPATNEPQPAFQLSYAPQPTDFAPVASTGVVSPPPQEGYPSFVTPPPPPTPENVPGTNFMANPQDVVPNTVTPSMSPLSLEDLEQRDQPPLSPMEKAMKSLVNLSDITEMAEKPVAPQKKNPSNRSVPLPPASFHAAQSLSEMQKHSSGTKPAREIMKVHAFDPAAAQAGAMVVYGSGQGLAAPSGFGVMAANPSYYHGQQVRV